MGTQQEYPIHPLARIFPPLTPERYAALVASIAALGLIDPITVWRGQIIDGVHRLRACAETGVEPRYEFLDDDADPREYVMAKHGPRRDLDSNQRAIVAYRLSQWSTPGRPRGEDENCSNLNSLTQVRAATEFGVSRTLLSYAGRVLSLDSTAVPELRQAVDDWEVKAHDAARVVNRSPEVQRMALDLVLTKKAKTIVGAVRQAEREMAQAEEAEVRESNLALALGETITLHTATVATLQTLVAPGSVDTIITHPPERSEFLPIFSDLAAFAAHALRDPGVLVIVGGAMFMPWALKNLEHDQLRWVAELDLVHRGQPGNSGTPRFMRLHRRPVLVYSKGVFRTNEMHDLFEVPPPGELPDGLNEEETAMSLLVERLVRPGQRVCDPIMLDRAGTALAARRHGCTFIGADKTQSCVDRIRKRLEDAEDNSQELRDPGSPNEEKNDG